jgi:hypothetical protein
MCVIGLLNGDVAAVDVVAKFFEPCRIIQNENAVIFGAGNKR